MTGSDIVGFAHIFREERQKTAIPYRIRKRLAIPTLFLLLTACGKTITHDRPVKVLVPVAQSCALPRPTPPAPLSARSDWDSLDVKQKSALVAKQALELRTAYEQLNAATAACP